MVPYRCKDVGLVFVNREALELISFYAFEHLHFVDLFSFLIIYPDGGG